MASQLIHDGALIWSTLWRPGEGFAQVVTRKRALSVVVLLTAFSVLATGVVLPHLDTEAIAGDGLKPEMTPHEREAAIETATKLYQVTSWAQAAVGPTASAFAIAVALWVAFWVAGARAGFKATFAVAAHALVPQVLKTLLSLPAATMRPTLAPSELSTLLPSSLASWLPPSLALPPPALAVASALDLFTLWSLVLIGYGMQQASGASRLRTWAVLLVLFAASVALVKVVPLSAG